MLVKNKSFGNAQIVKLYLDVLGTFRNCDFPVSVLIVKGIGVAFVLKGFRNCKLFRINLRAVLKLHRENAVVLRLLFHAADLDENHGVIAVYGSAIIPSTNKYNRIFVLAVKLAPNLLFYILHVRRAAHKLLKRNGVETVFIFGFIAVIFVILKSRYTIRKFFICTKVIRVYLQNSRFSL